MNHVDMCSAIQYSLTNRHIARPIDRLREEPAEIGDIPVVQYAFSSIGRFMKTQVMTRIVGVFTSVMAALDTVYHLSMGIGKGAALLLQRAHVIKSLPWDGFEVKGHFKQAGRFALYTLFGSLIGVSVPTKVEALLLIPLPHIRIPLDPKVLNNAYFLLQVPLSEQRKGNGSAIQTKYIQSIKWMHGIITWPRSAKETVEAKQEIATAIDCWVKSHAAYSTIARACEYTNVFLGEQGSLLSPDEVQWKFNNPTQIRGGQGLCKTILLPEQYKSLCSQSA